MADLYTYLPDVVQSWINLLYSESYIKGETYLDWLLDGVLWTVLLSLTAWVLAFTVGSLVGIMRTLPSKSARLVGTAYVELFRNIPLIVQLFIWFFVVPEFFGKDIGQWLKRDVSTFVYAFIGLGLYTASRVAEQIRAGIESIKGGLANAARASGMKTSQVYRYVLLPISYRLVIPPLTSEFLTIFKNSSVAFTITFVELVARTESVREATDRNYEVYIFTTLAYISIALIVTVLMHYLEKAVRIPGYIGNKGGK